MVVAVPYEYMPVMGAVMAFLALQVVAVAGRVYVRAFMVRAFGIDDAACVVTLLLACAFDGGMIFLWRISNLKTIGEVPFENWRTLINMVLVSELLYIVATMSLKVSLGLLLLRVLVKRWMKWVIYVTMVVSVVYGLVYFFIVLFQCGNPNVFWTKIVGGQCLSLPLIDGLSYTHGALTALADLIFAMLPIIFLRDVAFSRRAKISVGAILTLGSFGCVCTFVRIGWIHFLTSATLSYLVTVRTISLLSCIELSIGLVCISLATYRPLVNKCIRRRSLTYYYGDESGYTADHSAVEEMADIDHPYIRQSSTPESDASQNWGGLKTSSSQWPLRPFKNEMANVE